MSHPPLVSVILPALNEQMAVQGVVHDVLAQDRPLRRIGGLALEVIVADNGSVDGTPTLATQAGARTIHVAQRGYGHAIQAGLQAALGDYLVVMDCDGTYPANIIPHLLALMRGNDLQFVTTDRLTLLDDAMRHTSIAGNWTLNTIAKLLRLDMPRDSQSGMWAHTRDLLPYALGLGGGMEYSQQLKFRLTSASTGRWAEVPIHYAERIGNAKLRIVRDGLRVLISLLWLRLTGVPAPS